MPWYHLNLVVRPLRKNIHRERFVWAKKMVGLASLAAVARVVVQWFCSVLVLLLVGALLAEASPKSASEARPANGGAVADSQNSSAGKRCELPRDFCCLPSEDDPCCTSRRCRCA